MKLTMNDKLTICKEHIIEGKTLSHISERYDNFPISGIKYMIKLYKKHGEEPFNDRERRIYRRDTKLLMINRVKNGESIRSVAVDIGLTDPKMLSDWIKLYDKYGDERIQDTYPRKNYLNEDERYKKIVDKKLKEENERLKAEIEYLKKSRSLAKKLEELATKEKVIVVSELRTKYELKVLLEITNIPISVYYYQLNSINKKINKYEEIEAEIDHLYLKKHKKRIGYQRIYIELKNQGRTIGKNKVLEIMRKKGYSRKKKINYRKYNSYAGNLGGVVPNIIARNFKAIKPYEKVGTDITMFRINDKAVYLSPIIDFCTREVLAYEVGTDAKLIKVLSMLKKLNEVHRENTKGMIIQSMNRKGNCLDNSPTENFFGRLKEEIWYNKKYKYENEKDLITQIHEYIKYYNEIRIVTKLKTSPIKYRNQLMNSI